MSTPAKAPNLWAAAMTSTELAPDWVTGLEHIEGIDPDITPACEHSQHEADHPGDEPAAYIARASETCCGNATTYLLCRPGWVSMTDWVRCTQCRTIGPKRELIRIVAEL